jgi:hypothetical protein
MAAVEVGVAGGKAGLRFSGVMRERRRQQAQVGAVAAPHRALAPDLWRLDKYLDSIIVR